MAEPGDPQNRDEEPMQEAGPKPRFEHECPLEEIAKFISDIRTGEDGRMKLSPEKAAERIGYYLGHPNAWELILRKESELIGCTFAYEKSRDELLKEVSGADKLLEDGDRVFEIREVGIKPQYRGKHNGQKIMEEIMEEAKQKGATKLVLSTFPGTVAHKLYKKLGFKEVSDQQDPKNFYMTYKFQK